MKHCMAALAIALAGAGTAQAEVVSATAGGFEVRAQRVVAATPQETWRALGRIGSWWDSNHSYSGKAANMTLRLEPGGCFCETIPAGSQAGNGGATRAAGGVEHGRVLMAMPYVAVTLDSGLGPILDHGATGRLRWSLRAVAGGTEVTQTYAVGGYFKDGADKLAPIVDQVLGQALERLQKHLAD
jgi:uncharacterized protein YndB with AHSA1/START domain